jgi:hypothetical protein
MPEGGSRGESWLVIDTSEGRRRRGGRSELANLRPLATPGTSRSTSCWVVTEIVGRVLTAGMTAVDDCEDWYSRAFVLETVPSVLRATQREKSGRESFSDSRTDGSNRNSELGLWVRYRVWAVSRF